MLWNFILEKWLEEQEVALLVFKGHQGHPMHHNLIRDDIHKIHLWQRYCCSQRILQTVYFFSLPFVNAWDLASWCTCVFVVYLNIYKVHFVRWAVQRCFQSARHKKWSSLGLRKAKVACHLEFERGWQVFGDSQPREGPIGQCTNWAIAVLVWGTRRSSLCEVGMLNNNCYQFWKWWLLLFFGIW